MDSATTCICDKYGCKTGSTIYIKVNTDSDDVTWVFNENTLESLCDLRKGFEKKNASSSDTGKYICLVKNQERYIFDVVVYDNYETYECGVRSTLDLKVHTDSKFATWTLNGENVTSECNPQIGFKKNQAKFEDSGRYECTVDEKVINAFDVIVFEGKLISIGEDLELEANADSDRAIWILNGDHVVPEHPFFPGLIKRRVSFKDLGRYICKVNGIVKCAYEVIDIKHLVFKIGSNIRLTIETRISGSSWTLNEEEIPHECNAMTVLEKSHADFSDSGTYTWKLNGILRCVFHVEVHDDYECDTGSTIYLEVNSHSPRSYWTLYGRSINSECDPKKGFEKKNAVIRDSGRYVYVGDKLRCTFNVTIRDYVEIQIGATLHLMDIAEHLSSWTFNGKAVSSECKPKEGFEKKNVDYSDSGTYEYTDCLGRKNIFDVIVYGSCKKYECRFGSTIYLEVNSYRFCPKWTFNREQVSSECCPHKGFEKKNANFSDSGKYRCKVGDNVTHVFEVIVYEYLFEDEFLGIRITVPDEGSGGKPGILSKCELKPIAKPEKIDDIPRPPDSGYNMDRIPRGIAAIITIGKFDSLETLDGMDKDAERCMKVFSDLHFTTRICINKTADGIREFLNDVAKDIDENCDCFVLFVGSHGGHGYVCCKDFDDTKGFIYIDEFLEIFLPHKDLAEKPKLFFFDSCRGTDRNEEEEKLQQENELEEKETGVHENKLENKEEGRKKKELEEEENGVHENKLDNKDEGTKKKELVITRKNQTPLKRYSGKSLNNKYSHFVISYATIVGGSAWGTDEGGIYTQRLTDYLGKYAHEHSLLSVLAWVNGAIKEQVSNIVNYLPDETDEAIFQIAITKFTLEKTLILKKKPELPK